MSNNQFTRRQVLAGAASTTAVGLAGCEQKSVKTQNKPSYAPTQESNSEN